MIPGCNLCHDVHKNHDDCYCECHTSIDHYERIYPLPGEDK